MSITLLSLFSGIGAFERALENLGIQYLLAGYSEINKFVSKAYCLLHNVPESKNLGDVSSIDEKTLSSLPAIDLLTYGFPCQDISCAGQKKGLIDCSGNKTRSGLVFDAIRIIRHVKPKIAIAENVKLLSGKKMKKSFDAILSLLNEAGYNNYWKVMNCADYGLPQSRERLLMVSIRKDFDDGSFSFPEPLPSASCMGDYLETNVDSSFYLSCAQTKNAILFEPYKEGDIQSA